MKEVIWGISFPSMFLNGTKIAAVLLALVFLHFVLRAFFAKKGSLQKETKIYLYPKQIRIWHWVNMTTFFVLLVSGLLAWLKLIPKELFLGTHLSFAVLFIFSWTYIVAYNAFGNYGSYKITKDTFKEVCGQLKYYMYGIFKGEKPPHTPAKDNKFNALQKVSYFFMLYIVMPVFIITGMLERIEAIHKIMVQTHIYFCTFATVLFIIIHVYMVFSGSYLTQKLKAMIDGYSRH